MLAHEHAHLHHRHHLISALVEAIAAYLRWVPLIRAAADALPHYLEIAADDQARREAGTPALVSALVAWANAPSPPCHSTPARSPCTPPALSASATSSAPAQGWRVPCPRSRSRHT